MTTAPGGGNAGAETRGVGRGSAHPPRRALCPACSLHRGAWGPRPRDPGRNRRPGANSSSRPAAGPGPAGEASGAAERGPRVHSAPNSARPAARSAPLGPAGAAPRVTCQEPGRRPHLPPGRGNSRRWSRLPGAGQGEGPPRRAPLPRRAPPAARTSRSSPRVRALTLTLLLGPPPPCGHWLLLPSLSRCSRPSSAHWLMHL